MEEKFNPVANYKRGMEEDITAWQAKIISIEQSPDFSGTYKDFAMAQLNNSISVMKDSIVGFDKLTHPIKY